MWCICCTRFYCFSVYNCFVAWQMRCISSCNWFVSSICTCFVALHSAQLIRCQQARCFSAVNCWFWCALQKKQLKTATQVAEQLARVAEHSKEAANLSIVLANGSSPKPSASDCRLCAAAEPKLCPDHFNDDDDLTTHL